MFRTPIQLSLMRTSMGILAYHAIAEMVVHNARLAHVDIGRVSVNRWREDSKSLTKVKRIFRSSGHQLAGQ